MIETRKTEQRRLHPRLASGRDKTTENMKKYIYLTAFLLIGIFTGNQLFNHVDAWLGIGIIAAFTAIFIYKLVKFLKNENID